jgi:spermidine synthase
MIAASYFSEANNQKPLMYTGWTSFISSIGSLIGGGLFYLTSNVRIEPIPAVTLLLAFVFILLVGSFPFSKTHAWMLKVSGILLLAAVGWNFRHINIGDVYTKGRYAPKSLEYTENKIWAAPDSIHALVYARDRNRPWVFNYIDGHLSHELTHFHEVLVGLLGQQFFDQDVERSLIIGIGSGQTLSGLLEWSRHVDAIDLSQNPISAAKSAPEFNNDVMNNPRKTTFTMDGIQFIKSCQVESYDFILLTPTPIGLLHSTKLFSKEFLTGAKRCLKPDGILMTWFDGETIRRQQLLASIFKTTNMVFRNMALSLSPYPILFLSDVGLVKVADIEKGLFNEKIEKLAKAYNQGIYLIHFDAEELLPALRNVAALTLDSAGEAYWAEVDYYRKLSNPARPNTLLSVLLSRMFRSGYLPHQAFLERQEKLLSRYF